MPLFEYACVDCGHVFEKLVLARGAEPPQCPKCGRDEVEQLFSAFATTSSKRSATVCAPSDGG